MNFDMHAFYAEFLNKIRDDQLRYDGNHPADKGASSASISSTFHVSKIGVCSKDFGRTTDPNLMFLADEMVPLSPVDFVLRGGFKKCTWSPALTLANVRGQPNTGALADVVPFDGIGGNPGCPVWQVAYIVIARQMWKHYGTDALPSLEQHYTGPSASAPLPPSR